MPNRRLRAVSRTQGNNRALKDGTIRLPHYELDFEEVPVLPQAFRRMVRGLEFDVCEMALTTYLVAKRYGKPFTALPIFLVRGFHHGAILVRAGRGITEPKDLEGRAVGVNRGYTVTTGVWARGILHEEYGVDLDQVTWVLPKDGGEHVAEYQAPANVIKTDETPDAVIGLETNDPAFVPLLDEDGYGWLATKGWYPINHCIVVKDEVLTSELADELFAAFTDAKNQYLKQFGDSPADRMYQKVYQLTGQDPLPYGLEPNRDALETLVRYAIDQHILDERPDLDALFKRVGGA
jgi:4,5-dihydroxyphthalate decarboxylase